MMEETAGRITMTATDSISLHSGGQILAQGTDSAQGGRVTLRTDNGSITMDQGSQIDVSAGPADGSLVSQGDAGIVTMIAPSKGVTLHGHIEGRSLANQAGVSGRGGSFVLDTLAISESDMTGIIGELGTGGFNESIDIRARTKNIDIVTGQTLVARHVKVTADDASDGQGKINVDGTIEGEAGGAAGSVELNAMNDLTIDGTIKATSSTAGSTGGNVLLSSAKGWITDNGSIDVSGVDGTATTGGTVRLRALRDSETGNGNDSYAQMRINGKIAGQSDVFAEAFWVYPSVGTINSTVVSNWNTKTGLFMANADAVKDKIILNGSSQPWFHLLPGIEAQNSGDINLNTALDLHTWRWGGSGDPGVLTLRAGGNLTINANIVDWPTQNMLTGSTGANSWGMNLIAGGDFASANDLAVNEKGTGTLTIADQKLVFTESGPIRFASGGDTVIGRGPNGYLGYMINNNMRYNLASYSGLIEGSVGRDLSIKGGAIQAATGDIDIAVSRDLSLSIVNVNGLYALGSVRTTGLPVGKTSDYWSYAGGGNINIDVNGNLGNHGNGTWTPALSGPGVSAWDRAYRTRTQTDPKPYTWAASYAIMATPATDVTEGLATMGGGDLSVRTGGDFASQAGTFGKGNLSIYSNGDIKGRFLNKQGEVEIHAMGDFGATDSLPVIEAFDSRINAGAQGSIWLGSVVNPTIANDKFMAKNWWNMTYTQDTSVNLMAGGDITLMGTSPFYSSDDTSRQYVRILPPTVNATAGGNILFMNSFALAPSPHGNLSLVAIGGDIDGTNKSGSASIYVSDMDLAQAYGSYRPLNSDLLTLFSDGIGYHGTVSDADGNTIPLHGNDATPIKLQAGRDIKNLMLYLPKKAEITAGQDITDIYYFGQNVNQEDVSMIHANRDITFLYSNGTVNGFEQAGPGVFLIDAGGSIDLGNSAGIQSTGNSHNQILGTDGAKLLVVAGYDNPAFTTNTAADFFNAIRAETKSGDSYDQSTQRAEANIIPMLGAPSGAGNIIMTSSQISTMSGPADISIIANGRLDVGKTIIMGNQDVQTGIFTSEGGAINIFTEGHKEGDNYVPGSGDVNVNESRVMTFFGGDITVWSQYGDINAGRGSSTAVNAQRAKPVPDYAYDPKTGKLLKDKNNNPIVIGYHKVFTPPAVGSGIRAVTYDPDGVSGPLQAPKPGDLYPHAKVIDAGEAGIKGGNIYLQAGEVLHAANISSSVGSIAGLPQTSGDSVNMGSLSGSGSATQNSSMTGDVSGIAAARAQASGMIDEIIAKWLDVKVIDFVEDEN